MRGSAASDYSFNNCSHLDGHAGAVEALREEHPLARQPVVGARKLQL